MRFASLEYRPTANLCVSTCTTATPTALAATQATAEAVEALGSVGFGGSRQVINFYLPRISFCTANVARAPMTAAAILDSMFCIGFS